MRTGDTVRINLVATKAIPKQRRVFGFASVAMKADGTLPTETEGDVIDTPEAIAMWEDAFYDFVKEARVADDLHDKVKIAEMIECVVFTPEKTAAMAAVFPEWGVAKSAPIATWVGFEIAPGSAGDELVKKVASGERAMFSIEAIVAREPLGAAA